jgi:hypothetical protein
MKSLLPGGQRHVASHARVIFPECSLGRLGRFAIPAWVLLAVGVLAAVDGCRSPEHPSAPGEPPRQTQERPAKPEPLPPYPEAESRSPSDLPPPYLLEPDLAALGSSAGESFAASTSAVAAVGSGRVALRGLEVLLPWAELRRWIDERAFFESFAAVAERAGVRFVPGEIAVPTSAALVGRLTALVHRSGGGRVAADYALAVALAKPTGEVPWAIVLSKTKEGSKGPLAAHVLKGSDLDALASDAAAVIADALRERGIARAMILLDTGSDPLGVASDELGLKSAFADRILARVVSSGIVALARDDGTGGEVARLTVSAGGVSADPVIDMETYRFAVEISGAGRGVPWKRWERIVSRSGGRESR